jgi:histone-lysine N-methyltransferase SUV39H
LTSSEPPSGHSQASINAKSRATRLTQSFEPIQTNGRPLSSKGRPIPSSTPEPPQSSSWERKVNPNGEGFYINLQAETSRGKLPRSSSSADSSSQRQASVRRGTDGLGPGSDSEDALQQFRLPKPSPLKFKAEASPAHTIGRRNHATDKSSHRKHPSYDQADREKVKEIFSSSSRPTSSSHINYGTPSLQSKHGTHQPQIEARQRQSQRESKVPERLVTQPQLLKSINLPSRTTTPRVEVPRKVQVQHREATPVRSQISVVIPASQHKFKTNSFHADQSRKETLRKEMERSVDIVRGRAKSVETYFGTTGFSKIYGTTSDEDRLKKIHKMQPRVKKVKRRDVKLDWGDDVPQLVKPFRHDLLVHPREQVKTVTKSKVSSLTGPPITIINDIDDRGLNGKFQFISEYVIREGVKQQPAHLNSHINCSRSCPGGAANCSPYTCGCMRNDKMQLANGGAPVPTYRQRADGLIVLTETFLKLSKTEHAKSEIVECNTNCHCDETCFNRVVQKGRTLPLEIYMTRFCGFGLRSPCNIVPGQFIDVYLGELITDATLNKREAAQADGEPSYIFTLDWFNEAKDPTKTNPSQVFNQIDGENFGSSMRFVNHSCNANCGVFPVMLNQYDQNIYGLAVFAFKDIPAGTELTLDYAPTINEDNIGDYAKCQCGESNCRGYVWPKPRVTRKRKTRKGA